VTSPPLKPASVVALCLFRESLRFHWLGRPIDTFSVTYFDHIDDQFIIFNCVNDTV